MKQLLALIFLLPYQAYAWQPIVLRELSMEHRTFKKGSRNFDYDNAQIKDRELGQELNLNLDVDLLSEYIKWDNTVIAYVDRWKESQKPSQFRGIQWKFSVGIQPVYWLRFGYFHHSRHVMDAAYTSEINDGRFPVEDALFVKIVFYSRDEE